MKRSTRSFAKISNIHESVHQQLHMYALVAVLAVGSLALAWPAEAKVVYTHANVTISGNGSIRFDLNHDGKTDFTVDGVATSERCGIIGSKHFASVTVTPTTGNGVITDRLGAAALSIGAQIDSSQSFYEAQALMASETIFFGPPPCGIKNIYRGDWCGFYSCHPVDGYLGLEFHIKGSTHYAWAHMIVTPVNFTFVVKLTGFAYETIAGKAIKAGQKKMAADDPTNEDLDPGASLTSPIPDTPQPASLGMLALGAQGVPQWRRKESTLETL
jgi:hypothetical protein